MTHPAGAVPLLGCGEDCRLSRVLPSVQGPSVRPLLQGTSLFTRPFSQYTVDSCSSCDIPNIFCSLCCLASCSLSCLSAINYSCLNVLTCISPYFSSWTVFQIFKIILYYKIVPQHISSAYKCYGHTFPFVIQLTNAHTGPRTN